MRGSTNRYLYGYERSCTCGIDRMCALNDDADDESVQKYLDGVSAGEGDRAPGILELHWEIRPSQVKILVNHLHNDHEIYALHFNLHHLTEKQAKGIVDCKHLKQLIFTLKPTPKILKILQTREDWMLIYRSWPMEILQAGTDPKDNSRWAQRRKDNLEIALIDAANVAEGGMINIKRRSPEWALLFYSKRDKEELSQSCPEWKKHFETEEEEMKSK